MKRIAVFLLLVGALPLTAETVFFRSDHGLERGAASLPSELSDDHQVWKVELQSGHSTPCVIGNRIYLTTFNEESKLFGIVALDRQSGDTIWKKQLKTDRIEEVHAVGNPASASPASDGERVVVFFGSYGLRCYDKHGEVQWSVPMGPFQDEFGASSSPVIADGRVYLNEDHDAGNHLYAFDLESGDEIWKKPRDGFTRSYATPTFFTSANGKRQVLVAGALTLTSYDAETGDRLWWVDGLARIVNTTPVVSKGTVYVATWSPGGDAGSRIAMSDWSAATKTFDKNGDNRIARDELIDGPVLTRFFRIDVDQDGKLSETEWNNHAEVFQRARNSVLAIDPHGKGDLSDTHIRWKYERGIPYVASPTVVGDTIFMVKDGGILTSLDASTGEVGRQARLPGRGSYYSSIASGDGKLYVCSERGVLSVLSADRDWELLSSRDFGDRIYATPVIADGRVYLRTHTALYCFANES